MLRVKLLTGIKRAAFKFLPVILGGACCVTTAQAHATLLQTYPPSGGQLNIAPASVRLTFDERVEPIFNSVHVVDLEGRRVDDGESRVRGAGDVVEVGLKPLHPGQYVVLWKVNSADGHQVQGQFGFGFQSLAPDQAALQHFVLPEPNPLLKLSTVVVKGISLAALAIWLGGIFFLLAIATPVMNASTAAHGSPDPIRAIETRSFRLLSAAAGVYLVFEVVGLAVQSVAFTDLPLLRVLSPSTLRAVLFTTGFGQWWIVRILAAIVLAILSVSVRRLPNRASANESGAPASSRPIWLPISVALLGGLVLITLPLSGHARAVARATWLAVVADWLHLAATAIWIGGLVHFLASTQLINRNEPAGLELLSRFAGLFSRTAKLCVIVLLATGIYAAWLHLPGWESFLTTNYGRVLLAKLIVITPILAIAAVNLRRVLPALSDFRRHLQAARAWAARFRWLLRTETLLGVSVLAIVAVLTSLPPATAVFAGPVSMVRRASGTVVRVTIEPNRVGQNDVAISLEDLAGEKITDAKEVTIYLQMREMDMGLETIPAHFAPDGTYRADVNLSMTGRWSLGVQVSPAHADDFVADFDFVSGL